MRKQLHYFLLLALVAWVGTVVLIREDSQAPYGLWAVVAPSAWLIVLSQRHQNRLAEKAGRCVYCGYNLAADRRHPNYCPQCGSSQLQEAHRLRRQELLLEMERVQIELVRNHREQTALRYPRERNR